MKRIIITGGGPAGMMASIAAAQNGNDVLLLEKNEKLGKKIYITGKGRGNFTNSCETYDFFDNVVSNKKFLYSAIYGFDKDALLSFMDRNGMKYKEERGGRMFPLSDHASDITGALKKGMDAAGVEVRLNTRVESLLVRSCEAAEAGGARIEEGSGAYLKMVCGVVCDDGSTIEADHVIIAAGGLSYPATGSDGDGYRLAKEAGIEVTETYPALVPFEVEDDDIKELQGLSLKNISLTIKNDKKEIYSGFGELLFTHFGISGPLVLSASSLSTRQLNEGITLSGIIDFKPYLSEDKLNKRLLNHIEENRKRSYKRFYEHLLPRKLQGVVVKRTRIDPEKRIGEISKEERKKILDVLKRFNFKISATRGYSEAIVTQGGIAVNEVDPQTMYSKRVKNLSFAGEILDVDAYTGGYNMQIAFSTGYLAGSSI